MYREGSFETPSNLKNKGDLFRPFRNEFRSMFHGSFERDCAVKIDQYLREVPCTPLCLTSVDVYVLYLLVSSLCISDSQA